MDWYTHDVVPPVGALQLQFSWCNQSPPCISGSCLLEWRWVSFVNSQWLSIHLLILVRSWFFFLKSKAKQKPPLETKIQELFQLIYLRLIIKSILTFFRFSHPVPGSSEFPLNSLACMRKVLCMCICVCIDAFTYTHIHVYTHMCRWIYSTHISRYTYIYTQPRK